MNERLAGALETLAGDVYLYAMRELDEQEMLMTQRNALRVLKEERELQSGGVTVKLMDSGWWPEHVCIESAHYLREVPTTQHWWQRKRPVQDRVRAAKAELEQLEARRAELEKRVGAEEPI